MGGGVWGASVWEHWELNLWDLRLSQVGSVRIALNSDIPSWCPRIVWCCGGPLPPPHIHPQHWNASEHLKTSWLIFILEMTRLSVSCLPLLPPLPSQGVSKGHMSKSGLLTFLCLNKYPQLANFSFKHSFLFFKNRELLSCTMYAWLYVSGFQERANLLKFHLTCCVHMLNTLPQPPG